MKYVMKHEIVSDDFVKVSGFHLGAFNYMFMTLRTLSAMSAAMNSPPTHVSVTCGR